MKLSGKAKIPEKNLKEKWREKGQVKGTEGREKAGEKEGNIVRDAKSSLSVGKKEKKRVLCEGYEGFRRGQCADKRRAIRMETQ